MTKKSTTKAHKEALPKTDTNYQVKAKKVVKKKSETKKVSPKVLETKKPQNLEQEVKKFVLTLNLKRNGRVFKKGDEILSTDLSFPFLKENGFIQ